MAGNEFYLYVVVATNPLTKTPSPLEACFSNSQLYALIGSPARQLSVGATMEEAVRGAKRSQRSVRLLQGRKIGFLDYGNAQLRNER